MSQPQSHNPRTVGAFDAKTKFSELLDRAESGEVIIITRHGTPVATLQPYIETIDTKKVGNAIQGLLDLREEFLAAGPGLTLEEIKNAIEDGRK